MSSEKARSILACTRGASSSKCSCDHAALACTVQRSILPRLGLEDSRVNHATRWCVLRAAFHWGPRCGKSGLLAFGNASINVQQGATCTLLIASKKCVSFTCVPELRSNCSACTDGTANKTLSKPECVSGMSARVLVLMLCKVHCPLALRSMRCTWL